MPTALFDPSVHVPPAAVPYTHTQVGYVTLGVTAGALALLAGVAPTWRAFAQPGMVAATLALVAGGVLFATLTVRIEGDRLVWFFGPGFWRNECDLRAVERVEVVRQHALEGWGIRYTTRGWLYNVSGRRTVEITTEGTAFRLGTDEPERLAAALRAAQAKAR
jgi:hypothetical protein